MEDNSITTATDDPVGNGRHYYYDPHSKCIKCDPTLLSARGGGGTLTLSGVIADVTSPSGDADVPSFLRPGKLLAGEIIEIYDPSVDERKDYYASSSSLAGSAGGLLTRSFVETVRRVHPADRVGAVATSRDESRRNERLLQKQRELQTLHALENQRLMRKHVRDREWFHSQNLNEERLAELEALHQKEATEIQGRQQREQEELMDLVFDCLQQPQQRWSESTQRRQQEPEPRDQPRRQRPQAQRADEARLSSEVNRQEEAMPFQRAALSTLVVEAVPLPARGAGPVIAPPHGAAAGPALGPVTESTSRAPAAKVAPPAAPSRKGDEIKAVMNDRSLSREERRRRLTEIKEKYSTKDSAAAAAPADDPASSSMESINEKRRLELQSVMADRSIGRGEKQKRIAECRAKYAAMSARQQQRQAIQDKIIKMKVQVAASKQQRKAPVNNDDELEMARLEFSQKPPAALAASTNVDGRMSGSHPPESNSRPSISSRSSSSSSSFEMNASENLTEHSVSEEENRVVANPSANMAASRLNQAAVKAMIVPKTVVAICNPEDVSGEELGDLSAATDEPDLSSKERAGSHWDRAAVKSATTNISRAINESATSGYSKDDMAFNIPNRSFTSDTKPTTTVTEQTHQPSQLSIAGTDSNHTTESTMPNDPLESIPTDRTPIKKLVKRLNNDDPSLTVLKLDGRKKIKRDDWESLFESLEENTTLTHLSASHCDLSDEVVVSLVLALVENETLITLRLNGNKGLAEDTARGFIKVLIQSNKTVRKLELGRTKVTKKSIQKVEEMLEERNEGKKTARVQEERQEKIKLLLSFSAGDKVAKELAAQVMTEDEEAGEQKDDGSMGVRSHQSNSLLSKQSKQSRRSRAAFRSGTSSKNTSSSKTSSKKRTAKRGDDRHGRLQNSDSGRLRTSRGKGGKNGGVRQSAIPGGSGCNRRASMLRASVTAQQMAQLGGDIANVGADASKLKEQRRMRGECEVCGQRCFTKTMFKTTPLTIPNTVLEGRCLKCNPM